MPLGEGGHANFVHSDETAFYRMKRSDITMQKNELTPQGGRLETPKVETGVEIDKATLDALPPADAISFEWGPADADKITLEISKYTIQPASGNDTEKKIKISEEEIIKHPKISLVAVVGIPDERLGEEIKAYLVLKKEQKLSKTEFKLWITKKLAANKYPREIEIIKELPMNAIGKIIKRKLR